MSFFSHSQLFCGSTRTLVISGPHIQVIDSQDGGLLHSTVSAGSVEQDTLEKAGPIRCAAVDETFSHAVTAGDDKKLRVWEVHGLKVLSERELPKKPTAVHFTRDGQSILVSDKFGDVFSYPLHPKYIATSSEPAAGSKRGALTSHENPSDGDLILGHVSLLTCFLLSSDEKYIITADRDEHIRVSWYPQGYVIERYCLGHEKFVSALHIPPFSPSTLVSGGGDPMLKIWDWLSGTLLSEIPVLEAIEPFIKMKAPKYKWGREDGEGEDGGDGAGNSVRRKKKRGRKGRGKGLDKQKEEDLEGTPDVEGGEEVGENDEGETAAPTNVEENADTSAAPQASGLAGAAGTDGNTSTTGTDKLVLVIHKIQTVDLGEDGRLLVFSAVGVSALFYCTFPESGAAVSPTVHTVDLSQPVIDFTITPDNKIWVLLDPHHGKDDGTANMSQLAVLLSWASGKPVQVPEHEAPALLSTLRTTCVIPATTADRKTLDIYSALATMPKNVDPEHDPLQRDLIAEADGTPEPGADSKSTSKGGQKKELTQRELARLKKKRAVAATLQEQEQKESQSRASPATAADDVERDTKRARSETDVQEGDVMDES